MKKKFWIEMTGIFFLAGLLSCQQDVKETRLMSYNVKNGQGMDGFADYGRTANVILKEKPDVVALQELDSATMRSKGAYVLGELAQRTGMHATYAPAIDFDGGKYGIGILSKERPLSDSAAETPAGILRPSASSRASPYNRRSAWSMSRTTLQSQASSQKRFPQRTSSHPNGLNH